VIEPKEGIAKAKFNGAHAVDCLADGTIIVSTLSDENGNAPDGTLVVDRRESGHAEMQFDYELWVQTRQNVGEKDDWRRDLEEQPRRLVNKIPGQSTCDNDRPPDCVVGGGESEGLSRSLVEHPNGVT
jgi:56kDa selenium binding protein (SBP56)